jgi:hypothetical protein
LLEALRPPLLRVMQGAGRRTIFILEKRPLPDIRISIHINIASYLSRSL